jgi:hypothetical protein
VAGEFVEVHLLGWRDGVVLVLALRARRPEQEHHEQTRGCTDDERVAADADGTAGMGHREKRRTLNVGAVDVVRIRGVAVVALRLEGAVRTNRTHAVDDQLAGAVLGLRDAVDDDVAHLRVRVRPRHHEITEVVRGLHGVALDDDEASAATQGRRPEHDEGGDEEEQREAVEQVAGEVPLALRVRIDVHVRVRVSVSVGVSGHGVLGEVTRKLVKRTVPPPAQ